RIDAVMTVGSVTPEDLVTLMRGLEGTQVRLVVAPGLQDVVPGRMRALTVTQGWTGLIAVKTRRTRAAGKALFDRVAGAVGLALISPLLAATAIAIRIDSPGPVFYTQTRVGQNGKPFTMWKFRSMYIDSDARRASVVKAGGDAGNEVMFKDRQDPRITRVGRWIRRLSIDELPQLINVVRGDMSLVGPRPALPVEVAKYDAEALRRLLVKPGLTGLWQISGRSDLSWASTVALDRHYVENRGGALDAKIFAGTLRAVIGGKGAY
ncbi:MAG: sugar transferase, partial [Actinomyces sp.]